MELESSIPAADAIAYDLWSEQEFTTSSQLQFDSQEESDFLRQWVPTHLGETAGRWFIPQAPLDTLLQSRRVDGNGTRRIDFLVTAPWVDPFVVEIDGGQHTESEQLDRDRDAALDEAGIPVVRVRAEEVRRGSGPGLTSVMDRWVVPARDTAPEIVQLQMSPIQVQRLAFAITEGVELGYLAGERWVIEVDDDTGASPRLVRPYLSLYAALDEIWDADVMPAEIAVGDGSNWKMFRRSNATYDSMATIRGEPRSSDVSLRIRLEARKTANDLLSDPSGDSPTIVVRSASVPVRLSVGEPALATREFPSPPEGRRGDRALGGVLRAVFAKEEFREGQVAAIRQLADDDDCAVLLPTGAGKSLVYQFIGLCTPGITIVVDPIVSLMEDQLESLGSYGIERAISISAHDVQQGLKDVLLETVAAGEAMYVFIAPERLQQEEFRQAIRRVAQGSPVNIAVIDEAHCVSEWGHDFRTSYLNLGRLLRKVGRDRRGRRPPLLALTGTASRGILNDMLVELDIDAGIPGTVIKPQSFDREELHFSVIRVDPSEALATLQGQMARLPGRFREDAGNFFRRRGRDTRSGIVFCPHVNGEYGIVEVAEELTSSLGMEALTYSGSSPKNITDRAWEFRKRKNAKRFRDNEAPLLVSTKAFGMGIDKPNIRYVIHYGIPGSIEAYYQEAGRAGRDRGRAECVLILIEYDEARARHLLSDDTSLAELREKRDEIPWAESDDVTRQLFFHVNSFPGIEEEVETLRAVLDDLDPVGTRSQRTLSFHHGSDGREQRERALHRLVILGVLDDYRVDWGAKKFEVDLARVDSSKLVDRALDYVRRSQPGRLDSEESKFAPIRSKDLSEAILKASEQLIRFIYGTIERSRRRSLQEMWLAARETAGNADVDFRQRILDYLTEGELTPRLETLVDQEPFTFAGWIDFYAEVANPEEARELRGATGRLLEAYPDHPGLLVARGVSEIEIPGGSLKEFSSNVERGLLSAVRNYGSSASDIGSLVEWLLDRSQQLERPSAVTAIVAALERLEMLESTVREMEWQALDGVNPEPGLQVLGLTRALEEIDGMMSDFRSSE